MKYWQRNLNEAKATLVHRIRDVHSRPGDARGRTYFYFSTSAFLDASERAVGEVVEMVSVRRPGERRKYSPVIRFTDASGKEHEFRSNVANETPAYSEGDPVEIVYKPNNPTTARINTFFSLWGAALILGIVGIGFTFIGGLATIGRVRNGVPE